LNYKNAAYVFVIALIAAGAAARAAGVAPRIIDEAARPPEVRSVRLAPAAPAPGATATVTAEIGSDENLSADETVRAWVIFSADDGLTRETLDMVPREDRRTWRATLPPFGKGTEVLYALRAEDTLGNIYSEIPCMVATWPPDGETCLVDLAIDKPADDDGALVPDGLDIVRFRGGADGRYLYLELETQGAIPSAAAARQTPLVYAVEIRNPDPPAQAEGAAAPRELLAAWSPPVPPENRAGCALIARGPGGERTDSANIQCLADGSARVWFRISRKAIGDNPSGRIMIAAATGAFAAFPPRDGVISDRTAVTALVFLNRSINVKQINRASGN